MAIAVSAPLPLSSQKPPFAPAFMDEDEGSSTFTTASEKGKGEGRNAFFAREGRSRRDQWRTANFASPSQGRLRLVKKHEESPALGIAPIDCCTSPMRRELTCKAQTKRGAKTPVSGDGHVGGACGRGGGSVEWIPAGRAPSQARRLVIRVTRSDQTYGINLTRTQVNNKFSMAFTGQTREIVYNVRRYFKDQKKLCVLKCNVADAANDTTGVLATTGILTAFIKTARIPLEEEPVEEKNSHGETCHYLLRGKADIYKKHDRFEKQIREEISSSLDDKKENCGLLYGSYSIEQWERCCKHVKNIESAYFKSDELLGIEIDRLIVKIGTCKRVIRPYWYLASVSSMGETAPDVRVSQACPSSLRNVGAGRGSLQPCNYPAVVGLGVRGGKNTSAGLSGTGPSTSRKEIVCRLLAPAAIVCSVRCRLSLHQTLSHFRTSASWLPQSSGCSCIYRRRRPQSRTFFECHVAPRNMITRKFLLILSSERFLRQEGGRYVMPARSAVNHSLGHQRDDVVVTGSPWRRGGSTWGPHLTAIGCSRIWPLREGFTSQRGRVWASGRLPEPCLVRETPPPPATPPQHHVTSIPPNRPTTHPTGPLTARYGTPAIRRGPRLRRGAYLSAELSTLAAVATGLHFSPKIKPLDEKTHAWSRNSKPACRVCLACFYAASARGKTAAEENIASPLQADMRKCKLGQPSRPGIDNVAMQQHQLQEAVATYITMISRQSNWCAVYLETGVSAPNTKAGVTLCVFAAASKTLRFDGMGTTRRNEQREHCTRVQSLARRCDGALDVRDFVALISLPHFSASNVQIQLHVGSAQVPRDVSGVSTMTNHHGDDCSGSVTSGIVLCVARQRLRRKLWGYSHRSSYPLPVAGCFGPNEVAPWYLSPRIWEDRGSNSCLNIPISVFHGKTSSERSDQRKGNQRLRVSSSEECGVWLAEWTIGLDAPASLTNSYTPLRHPINHNITREAGKEILLYHCCGVVVETTSLPSTWRTLPFDGWFSRVIPIFLALAFRSRIIFASVRPLQGWLVYERFGVDLNVEVLRADEGEARQVWSSVGMKALRSPRKPRRPAASSGTIPTWRNPGMNPPGIGPVACLIGDGRVEAGVVNKAGCGHKTRYGADKWEVTLWSGGRERWACDLWHSKGNARTGPRQSRG
ncbi:hypothetical protein PR048_009824 [Dryococelus australis]|uniref:Uncharacterized protein n=1 Tax=Dryococelus australis TaxID=614101 RepID=A0ABQ9I1S0_9NEOP|nr:hypothetical protein PR048_009824 [Dryococelus australis]